MAPPLLIDTSTSFDRADRIGKAVSASPWSRLRRTLDDDVRPLVTLLGAVYGWLLVLVAVVIAVISAIVG